MEPTPISPSRIAALVLAVLLAGGLAFGPEWMSKSAAPASDDAASVTAAHDAHGKAVDDPYQPRRAQRALAVFVVCLALWLTQVIPLAITGLLAFALLPLLGVSDSEDALRHLGNEAVFFMLGVFFLVAAMIATGLSKRLTLLMLQRMDTSPRRLFLGVLLTASSLALVMPEHAVAAMLFPVVLEVVEALGLQKGRSRYARLLFLAMAWGACIGGIGTFLGGARAPLAVSLLEKFDPERHIGFLDWALAAVPPAIVLTGVAALLLPLLVGIDVRDVSNATAMINERVTHMGRIGSAEKRLAAISVLTIVCWITLGEVVGVEVIAVASACSLFLLRVVAYKDIQEFINWNVLLMYGGAIAIGSALKDTGAAGWLVHQVDFASMPPEAVIVILAVAALILTECISNAATVVVLLPIGFGIASETGMNPLFITLAVTVPAGLPFCLPVSSPPHAIAFSSGYYAPRDCLKPGLLMDFTGLAVVIAFMFLYWPLLGISVMD